MKLRNILTVLLCTLALVCGIGAGLISSQNKNYPEVVAEEIVTTAPITPKKPVEFVVEKEVISSDKYMVCLTDIQFCISKISVDGSSQLIEATEFKSPIESTELSRFYPGVFVETLEEARELIEDYIN